MLRSGAKRAPLSPAPPQGYYFASGEDSIRARKFQELSSRLSRLLVAIDGSEQSDYALNVALKIGERFGSKIDLIHVHSPTGSAAAIIDPVIGSTNVIIPAQSENEGKGEE